jgi:hypothetical protein
MAVLGRSILNRALSRVGTDSVMYYQFTGRAINGAGINVSTYAFPVCVQGSLQPVAAQMLTVLGLDLARDYVQFYTQTSINDIERNKSPDQFVYNNIRYEVVSDTDWMKPQGFTGVMAVRISPP